MFAFIQRNKFLFLFLIVILGAILRLYNVSNNPPGLYIDEISTAYNANEILTKGVDQFGVKYPLWFRAFGEYKMPVLVYLTSGSIALFGRTEYAVRFPSAAAGIFTLIVFYFLVEELSSFAKKHIPFSPPIFSLVSTLFLAISPWHIQFSRGGFENNVALFFYILSLLLGVYFYKHKKSLYLFLSFLFLALTMYTYNAFRFIAPVTFIAFLGVFYFKSKENIKRLLPSALFFVILILPVVLFSLTGQGITRFSETSALSVNKNIFQNLVALITNYISYFSFKFLFVVGDGIGRHEMPNFGVLQFWNLPFLILGLYFTVKYIKNALFAIIIFLLFITPIPAALTVPSPHALRSLLMVVPFTLMISYGFLWTLEKLLKGRGKLLIPVILLVIVYEFFFYLHFYYYHYPIVNSPDWGAGYKEMVQKTMKYKPEFKHVIVDSKLQFAPLYFGFYTNDKFQPLMVDENWVKLKEWANEDTLLIVYHCTNLIDTVNYPGKNDDVFAEFCKL